MVVVPIVICENKNKVHEWSIFVTCKQLVACYFQRLISMRDVKHLILRILILRAGWLFDNTQRIFKICVYTSSWPTYLLQEWETYTKTLPDGTIKRFRRRVLITVITSTQKIIVHPDGQEEIIEESDPVETTEELAEEPLLEYEEVPANENNLEDDRCNSKVGFYTQNRITEFFSTIIS